MLQEVALKGETVLFALSFWYIKRSINLGLLIKLHIRMFFNNI